MWLVAKVSSMLEAVRVRVGRFITAALLIRRLIGGMVESVRRVSAAVRTESWEERSRVSEW